MLDIKLLIIAANLTLGEVIWLLFELVLIVIRTRNVKTAVICIEIALYQPKILIIYLFKLLSI